VRQIFLDTETTGLDPAKARIVEGFEREYIQALVKRHKGNLSAASRAAEIDRKHLRELLRKHGLRESGDT